MRRLPRDSRPLGSESSSGKSPSRPVSVGRRFKHVLRDAVEVFALTDDGQVIPINGDCDPADPLTLLSPQRWLEQVKTREPFLFV
jgi:hypothetical protein